MIFNVVGLLIGIMILAGGIYYLVKEKADKESRVIYGIAAAGGLILAVFMLIRLFL